MINKDNFKDLLLLLDFREEEIQGKMYTNIYSKDFPEINAYLKVDLDAGELIYPEDKGLVVNTMTTCNFSQNENFVVFECIHNLFKQGYKPEHIELEPKWKLGHEAKSGRADILVKNFTNKPLLIIECKIPEKFDKEWETMKQDGGQLFSYLNEERNTKFICLYTSDFTENKLTFQNYIITITDIQNLVEKFDKKPNKPMFYKDATNAKEFYKAWKDTYKLEYSQQGIFGEDFQAYNIGSKKITIKNLQYIWKKHIQGKYNEFATILRQHNVSGRENAFDKLVNLFLCKIVDETTNPNDLKFYWKGEYFDNYFDLIDRLQKLYSDGMKIFLEDKVTYIDFQTVKDAFKYVKNDPDATQDAVLKLFKEQKYFTNNDFSFIDVHNEILFFQNADILLKVINMWQIFQINGDQQNQFLGDMFECFLDKGIKQSEGQFFTPIPICKFIIMSLPLESIVKENQNPLMVIDYACGAGHFLTEFAAQIQPHVKNYKKVSITEYYKNIFGIEKEYRLSKVAKVSAFMYNQKEINITCADALAYNEKFKDNSFSILVANPPYSVKGFLETLSEDDRNRYFLTKTIDAKSIVKNNTIETFFIERAKQLLKSGGIAGLILPTSILSRGSKKSTSDKENTYVATREILLQYFDIVAIAELGSGTFSKAGTTTAILFLGKRCDNPEPYEHYKCRVNTWFKNNKTKDHVYEDVHFLKKYCEHVEIMFDDYETLLENNPSETLLNYEIFKEYVNDFKNSKDTKDLKESYAKQINNLERTLITELNKEIKSSKTKLSEADFNKKLKELMTLRKKELEDELEKELRKNMVAFIQSIETDKLLYFILATINKQNVLIIKSPAENREKKNFLGYEWSSRKGDEGIKYIGTTAKTVKSDDEDDDDAEEKDDIRILSNIDALSNIKTPLYDNDNPLNPEKINYYVQQNFLGNTFEIPEHLQLFVTKARLVDMIDFKRKNFDKTISLTPKKNININTKWELVRIEDFVNLIESGSRPAGGVGNITFGAWSLGGEHIHASLGTVDLSDPKYVPFDFFEESKKGILKENDILLCKDGALTGKIALLRDELKGRKAMINEHVFIIRCNDITNQKYLFNFLFSEFGQMLLKAYVTGAAQGGLNSTNLKNIKVPKPDNNIQKKIVEECELIDKETIKSKVVFQISKSKITENIDNIIKSTNNFDKIGNLCTVNSGGTPSRNNPEYWNNGTIPWLKSEVCKEGHVDEANEFITEEGLRKSNAKYFETGTTLIALVGATKGKTAFLKFKATTNQNIAGIFSKDEKIFNNQFLFYVCRGMYNILIKDLTQYDMLNLTQIRNIQIPVPDIKEQEKLVKEIEKSEKQITDAETIINEAASKKNEIIKKYL
ncbi:MAG: restriction endonuclease subunit S [Bacteroidia bacterium]|nr:restriction endonuclease subunit S [Bacteroidia bacterium]